MKKIINFFKYFFIIVALFYIIGLILYQTNFIHWGLQKLCFRSQIGCVIEDKIHDFMTPFNLHKVTLKNSLSKEDYIDLKLSINELKYIKEKTKYFIEVGFIEDRSNEWRDAHTLIDGEYHDIKYKFHGTSTTPLKNSRNRFWQLFEKFGIQQDISLNNTQFSLKIKHKKSSKYRGLVRRYNLISTGASGSIDIIAMNAIAQNLGLLAGEAQYKVLRINGIEMGAFIFVESHSKEWFEREHNITNYSVIKSIDDWDTREPGHISDLDLTIEYKEIKTIGKINNIALRKLELLFNAIKIHDVKSIKKLINTEDMANYLALYTLYNDNHPLTGDNLKYIYNLSTGKFRFIFRVEGKPILMKGPTSNFNYDLFNSYYPEEMNLLTHKLFKILLQDYAFRKKRDDALIKIINDWDDKVKLVIEKVYNKNKNIILQSIPRGKSTLYRIEHLKEVLNFHKSLALKYLEYNKVYITRKISNNYFTIYNDCFSGILLKSITYKNDKGQIKEKIINKYFPPLNLNESLIPVIKKYDFSANFKEGDTIIEFNIINELTGNQIENKHIYFNKSSDKLVKNTNLQINSFFIVDHKLKTLTLTEGEYIIKNNIITPYGYKVILEPGVKILLSKSKSILIKGPLIAEGLENNKIEVKSLNDNEPFGTFSILPIDKNSPVQLKYFEIKGGNEAIIDGVYFSGQMSIHSANVFISDSTFLNSVSDDGINIKYSEVNIKNSYFANNLGDQIDLDYCTGSFSNNTLLFESYDGLNNIEIDGLDISGSEITITKNIFKNFSDKGISVGENSYPSIYKNSFSNSNMAIAVKDGSIARIDENIYQDNNKDISLYIKKKLYSKPSIILSKENKNLNINISKGDIIYQ